MESEYLAWEETSTLETVTYTPKAILRYVQVAVIDLWWEYSIPKVLWRLSVNHY